MSKHTPGEWLLADADPTFVYVLNEGGSNRMFLKVQGGYASHSRMHRELTEIRELEACGRLICKAPKMADLLTRIYTECDERDEGNGGRFSVELMEELRQFVQKQQLEERDHG